MEEARCRLAHETRPSPCCLLPVRDRALWMDGWMDPFAALRVVALLLR